MFFIGLLPSAAFAQEKIILGFSQVGAESEWHTVNADSIKASVAEAGIELKFSDAQQRQKNQIKAIRSFIAQNVDGDFTRAKGKEVMEVFLKAEGKEINVLFARTEGMAIGSSQAVEESTFKPVKDIMIMSIDAVKGAFDAMITGKLNVSVECGPLLGSKLMAVMINLKAGKTLQKRILTEESIFPMEVAARVPQA